ncbi:unnamed protein product [Heterobilharzia americana]|nr:unnamed protein product [Heterobilharzia americana]CAH8505606.1 unnamed protein product [Heterobilharzia americana]
MISQLQQQLEHQHRHPFETSENKTNLTQFCLNLPDVNSAAHIINGYDTHISVDEQQSVEQERLNSTNEFTANHNSYGVSEAIKPRSCATIPTSCTTTINGDIKSTEETKQNISRITCTLNKHKLDNQLGSCVQHSLRYLPNTTITTPAAVTKNSIEFSSDICYNSKYPRFHNSLTKYNINSHDDVTTDINDSSILEQTGNSTDFYEFQRNVKQLIDYELNSHLRNEYNSTLAPPLSQQPPPPVSSSSPSRLSKSICLNNETIKHSLNKEDQVDGVELNKDKGIRGREEEDNEDREQEIIGRNNDLIDDTILDSLSFKLGRTIEKMDVLNNLQKFSKLTDDLNHHYNKR